MPYPGRADGRNYTFFPKSSRDPTPLAGYGKLYCKLESGIVQLFYQTDDGTVSQLTPISGGDVTSVFGRNGDVVATLGDYLASLITNDSGVPGATIDLALDALANALTALDSSDIANVSGVTGATITAALETLKTTINGLTTNSINNSSSVGGALLTTALNTLLAASGVSTVFSRNGAVVAAANDYLASQIQNDSGVSGTGVAAALNTLNSGKAPVRLSVATVSGTKVLTSADVNVLQNCTAASAMNITANSNVFQAGDVVPICQYGAGQVTINGTATRRAKDGYVASSGQYAYMGLVFLTPTEVLVVGDRA